MTESSQWVADASSEPEQPPPGGMCDTCGHFALRHYERGCNFPRPKERPCNCKVFVWQGNRWPRPWLAAASGGMEPLLPAEPPPYRGYIVFELGERRPEDILEAAEWVRQRLSESPVELRMHVAVDDQGLGEIVKELKHG
jgi:hypothetical protein